MSRFWIGRLGLVCALLLPPALPERAAAQVSFEAALKDLSNTDTEARLRAVQMFKRAGYPESAIPLAAAVTDPIDQIQFEAIAAELNIFLAEPVVPNRRVGLLIEVRTKIAAEPVFSSGPLALNAREVPGEVLAALARAYRDENPLVAVEALYAFGTLGIDASGPVREELLRVNGPQLAGMLGVPDLPLRIAAARVIGRLFERRPGDAPIEQQLGDAVIAALNDRSRDLQLAAMEALGALRYERGLQALTEFHEYHRRNPLGIGALAALSRVAHRVSAPAFQNQLTAGNSVTKILAIEGLARIGDPGMAANISSTLARERHQGVRLAETFATIVLSNAPIDPLIEALARPDLRDQAVQYLIEIAPGRSAAFSRVRQDPDARIRADIADALGLSRDRAALPLVEAMLQDKDPGAARAAERAVARLRRLR